MASIPRWGSVLLVLLPVKIYSSFYISIDLDTSLVVPALLKNRRMGNLYPSQTSFYRFVYTATQYGFDYSEVLGFYANVEKLDTQSPKDVKRMILEKLDGLIWNDIRDYSLAEARHLLRTNFPFLRGIYVLSDDFLAEISSLTSSFLQKLRTRRMIVTNIVVVILV